MTTLVLERAPLAESVEVDEQRLAVLLADGRTLFVPLDWFPRLLHATPAERAEWRLLGGGEAVEWPLVDEQVSVEGLLAGRRSGESPRSLERWLAQRAGETRPA